MLHLCQAVTMAVVVCRQQTACSAAGRSWLPPQGGVVTLLYTCTRRVHTWLCASRHENLGATTDHGATVDGISVLMVKWFPRLLHPK